jgi:hypothetical protein
MDTHFQMARAQGQHLPRPLVGGIISDAADLVRKLLAVFTAFRKIHGHFLITPSLLSLF